MGIINLMAGYLLSIDGGATKTVSAILNPKDMKITGIGVGGPSNFNAVGAQVATDNIRDAINMAFYNSSLTLNDIDKLLFSLAGVGDSEESDRIATDIADSISESKPYLLFNDGIAGYRLANLFEDGILVYVGTGNVNYYQKNGVLKRVGGWGWFAGDEGSASWIARRAITYAVRQYDGLLEGDELVKAVEEHFGGKFKEVIWRLEINHSKPEVASFAPKVTALAAKNYKAAKMVVEEAADYIASVIKRLLKEFESPPRISIVGGLALAGNVLIDEVRKRVPHQIHVFYGYQVVVGGLMILLKDMNYDVDFDLLSSLLKQLDQKITELGKPLLLKYFYFEKPPGGWG